ncbi:MAG: hypothetical protein IT436_12655 [Phycisphaerales bacterium]|nr:hypothetical protein [Phycisphaerales bacterium]
MIREVGAGAGYAWRCVLSVVALTGLCWMIAWLSDTTRWTSPIIVFGGLGMIEYWRIATFERVRNMLQARGWTHYRFRKCWKCGYEVGGPRVEACPECGELRYLRLGDSD